MSDQTNLGHSFDKLMSYTFYRYRGILLERRDGYFMCIGVLCRTLWDVDRVIDGAGKSLNNSINRKK